MVKATNRMTEVAGDAVPLFADPDREYYYVTRVQRYRRIEGGARFSVLTNEDEEMTLDLRFVTPEVLRVRLYRPGEEPPLTSPMLVEGASRSADVDRGDGGRQGGGDDRRASVEGGAEAVPLRRLRPAGSQALRPADRRPLVLRSRSPFRWVTRGMLRVA